MHIFQMNIGLSNFKNEQSSTQSRQCNSYLTSKILWSKIDQRNGNFEMNPWYVLQLKRQPKDLFYSFLFHFHLVSWRWSGQWEATNAGRQIGQKALRQLVISQTAVTRSNRLYWWKPRESFSPKRVKLRIPVTRICQSSCNIFSGFVLNNFVLFLTYFIICVTYFRAGFLSGAPHGLCILHTSEAWGGENSETGLEN